VKELFTAETADYNTRCRCGNTHQLPFSPIEARGCPPPHLVIELMIPLQDAIAAILENYRDMSHLREMHDEYRRKGQEYNRQGYHDCRRVFRYQRLLDDGEEI
jgi:hypothetical protein